MLFLKEGIIYLQIYEYYKKEIIKGTYVAHSKLPSKRRLSNEYQISLTSVENAYAKLLEEGFIYAKERKGYFVSDVGELYVLENKQHTFQKETSDIRYDFSYTGVSDEGFPHKIFRKFSNLILEDNDLLEQVDYQGYFPLRMQIADYLNRSRGFQTSPSRIIISSGSEYLFQIIFKLVEGTYAIEDPGYHMLRNIMDANEIRYECIPLDEFGMSIDALQNSSANICALTPAHQFPTGIIMNMKRRSEILNCSQIDFVIEDDYDSEFKYSNRPVPALKSIDYPDKVIYMGSFSKSISPSMRVSYMVLPESLLEKYHQLFHCFVCPVSIIIQKILTKFLESGEFEKHLNRMRKIYSKKRQLIVDLLKDCPDIKITGADAGLHVVLQYPKYFTEKDIVAEALKQKIAVYGLESYGKKQEYPSILLGFATLTNEEITEGISLLKAISYHSTVPSP